MSSLTVVDNGMTSIERLPTQSEGVSYLQTGTPGGGDLLIGCRAKVVSRPRHLGHCRFRRPVGERLGPPPPQQPQY
jgi:hypothetical protein